MEDARASEQLAMAEPPLANGGGQSVAHYRLGWMAALRQWAFRRRPHPGRHDLRNPLAALRGHLQILSRSATSATPAKQQQVLRSIEAATKQMSRLVDDLGDVGAIGASRFAIRTALVDLVPIAQRVIALHQAATTSHHLVLEAPARLEGEWDGERLGQLLANLISNAIKYAPAGGEVRMVISCVAGKAIVRVSDQGIGLSPEQIGRLFQAFTRLYRGTEIKGSGLGLYISKAIVEAHGGQIRVDSEPDRGSTFTVTLPLRSSDHQIPVRRFP
jgi:signal transduction histidine kinase